MIKLRRRDFKTLERAMKRTQSGDLYHALHRVGDDDTKMLIEGLLKQTLGKKSFAKLVAIFKLTTNGTW